MSEADIIRSRVRYEAPKDGTNLSTELLDAFRRHADRSLIVDAGSGREWTGKMLLDRSSRVATNLVKEVGIKPGSVVLTMCEHNDREIILVLGLVLSGAAFFGSTTEDGYSEMKSYCELVKPDVIVTQSSMHHVAAALRRNVEGLAALKIVWIDNPVRESITANGDLANGNRHDLDRICLETMERDEVILYDALLNGPLDEDLIRGIARNGIDAKRQNLTYMLTSGSTGRPKVVPSTHEEIVHGLYSMLSASKYPVGSADGEISSPSPLMCISQDSILAGDLPLDHGVGVNTMFLSIHKGSKMIIMPSYDVDLFWGAVNDYRITMSFSSTTFAYKLVSYLKILIDSSQTKKWDLSSFKYIACAGAKMAFIDLVREVNRVYTDMKIVQCYGATEIGFLAMLRSEDATAKVESVGHLFPGLKVKIVDRDTGRSVARGQRGELCVWANSKFKSYRCHPSDDVATIMSQCHDEHGFYKTGDQVHMDEDGRLYIHGRFKDTLFLREDWKILPVELEDLINKHPLVEQSAVVGVSDVELPGCDAPKAFVKLISRDSRDLDELDDIELKSALKRQDKTLIAKSIYAFVADRTASPKHLRGGIRILDKFPTVGLLNKVDRIALKKID